MPKIFAILLGLCLSALFFQNCSPSSFEAVQSLGSLSRDLASESGVILSSARAPLSKENPSGPVISLMSDGYIVSDGHKVQLLPNGEAIFVWRADFSARRCFLAGLPVPAQGGPQAFSHLKGNTDYEFRCESDRGQSAIRFKATPSVKRASQSVSGIPFSVDVFIIAGQSNAVGQDIKDQSPLPLSGQVLRFHKDKLQMLNSLGAWSSFGSLYLQRTQTPVVFVPTAKGGTGSSKVSDFGYGHWGPDGSLHADSVALTKKALAALAGAGYHPRLRGVLWVQGENDALAINQGHTSKEAYAAALDSVIQRYRDQLGSSLPFFIFQTGTAVGFADAGFATVRSVQAQVSAGPNNKLVFSGALSFPARKLMWDEFHYHQEGYDEMGKVGAASVVDFLAAKGGVPSEVPRQGSSPAFVDQCKLQTADGRTQFSISDNVVIQWKAMSNFTEVGQRNKVFNAQEVPTAVHSSVVTWGPGEGTRAFSSRELAEDLTPLLLQSEVVRIQYEMMQKGAAGVWNSCNTLLNITWRRPSLAEGYCEIPRQYQTTCGLFGVKVFRGGICRVLASPAAAELGLAFRCNNSNKWEVAQ